MLEIADYQINTLLYSGSRTKVYRAVRTADSLSVVIKVPNGEYPSFNQILQLRHQYALALNLQISGIVKPLALERYGNGYALVMEDCGGISLWEYADNKPLPLGELLAIALSTVQILQRLKERRVIHKDIKPENILINPETKEILGARQFCREHLIFVKRGYAPIPNSLFPIPKKRQLFGWLQR